MPAHRPRPVRCCALRSRSRPVLVRATVGVLALAAVMVAAPHPASASHRLPPVGGEVVDPFRPPTGPYGPGNRGVELATVPGRPVRAAADGTVTFAGPVAGTRAVTVRDAAGLRISVTHLATVSVPTGAAVRRGTVVGTTGPRTHVGVRDRSGRYLDPVAVFGHAGGGVRLVPPGRAGPASGSAVGPATVALASRAASVALARAVAAP